MIGVGEKVVRDGKRGKRGEIWVWVSIWVWMCVCVPMSRCICPCVYVLY